MIGAVAQPPILVMLPEHEASQKRTIRATDVPPWAFTEAEHEAVNGSHARETGVGEES